MAGVGLATGRAGVGKDVAGDRVDRKYANGNTVGQAIGYRGRRRKAASSAVGGWSNQTNQPRNRQRAAQLLLPYTTSELPLRLFNCASERYTKSRHRSSTPHTSDSS